VTKIHVNISEARRVRKDVILLRESIQRILRQVNTSTNSLFYGSPSSWQSDSANEFQTLYQESVSEISGILEPLNDIAAKLDEAIEEAERVDRRLSR